MSGVGPSDPTLADDGGSGAEVAWRAFDAELALWRRQGRPVAFWWRDDDAGAPSASLERLLALAGASGVPLALAAIPQDLQARALRHAGPGVHLLQHGVDHRNRAEPGGKKTEFPAGEPVADALARLRAGLDRLSQIAPGRVLPVLVPPWNRMSSPELLAALPRAGLRGLSRYGPRGAAQAGLAQVNTHVDIIDWRGGRRFAGAAACLGLAVAHLQARRQGHADADEPTGWLTHHAVHDEPAWAFLEALFARTRSLPGVRWVLPSF